MQTFSNSHLFHPVALTFPKALEPFVGSFVSGWQVKGESEHVDHTEGFLGQLEVGHITSTHFPLAKTQFHRCTYFQVSLGNKCLRRKTKGVFLVNTKSSPTGI